MRSIITRLGEWFRKSGDWWGELGGTKETDGEEGDWRRDLEEFKGKVHDTDLVQTHEDLPGHGHLPGGEPGGSISWEDETRERIPGADPMESYQGVDIQAWKDRIDERMLQVFSQRDVLDIEQVTPGDREGITTDEFEKVLETMGPLTWRGVDGWMKKVEVVGSGKRWSGRLRGWVRMGGRGVEEVVGEMSKDSGKSGLVDERRID